MAKKKILELKTSDSDNENMTTMIGNRFVLKHTSLNILLFYNAFMTLNLILMDIVHENFLFKEINQGIRKLKMSDTQDIALTFCAHLINPRER